MISVAIDGPAGAGKSSISRIAAKKLGFIYVDTGALYRAVGLKFALSGADTSLDCDIDGILSKTAVDIRFVNGEQRVFLDGEDVSDKIRTPKASMMASAVSARPQVRAFLLEMQRKLARENNVIMDGRDIGTVILPDAQVKIFLTASPETRAARRFAELKDKGTEPVAYARILEDMKARDALDASRAVAPLKQAPDAVLLDTSEMTLDESIQAALSIVRRRIKGD